MSQLKMNQANLGRPSKTNRLPEAALAELSPWIAHEFGLHFPRERWHHLEREISAAAADAGFDAVAYFHKLLARNLNSEDHEALIQRLTVAETYFFREAPSLEAYVELALPKIGVDPMKGAGPHRIWSAGCASGEEPYSIAMLLHKSRRFDVEILGTDLNAYSLRKAVAGIYTDWSFRGTPPWVKQAHFRTAANNAWELAEQIKKMVTFVHMNLLDDCAGPSPSPELLFDVIFCRNVLMYFTPEAITRMVARFYQCLAPEGWLVVGVTETSQHLFPEFEPVHLRNATLYRKPAHASAAKSGVLHERDRGGSSSDKSIKTKIGPPLVRGVDGISVHFSKAQMASSHTRPLMAPHTRTLIKKHPSMPLPPKQADTASILTLARQKAGEADLHSALALCEQALRADRITVAGHYLRALILQELDLPAEATRALHQSIYLEPEFVLGHFALGNLALRAGRRKESRKHFENVLFLLAHYRAEDTVPHSEGLSVGRLREIAIGAAQQAAKVPAAGLPRGNFLNTRDTQ